MNSLDVELSILLCWDKKYEIGNEKHAQSEITTVGNHHFESRMCIQWLSISAWFARESSPIIRTNVIAQEDRV